MSPSRSREDPQGPKAADLSCHPAGIRGAVRRLEARASLLDAGLLSVGFTLAADLEALAIPPAREPARRDRLWEHTCFEAFLAISGREDYGELNLAPSTEWAAYAFRGYRGGMAPIERIEPRIVVHRREDRLDLHALVPLPPSLAPASGQVLRLALAAVVEARDGALSHWALRHPSDRPDFHHPDAFAMELAWTLED